MIRVSQTLSVQLFIFFFFIYNISLTTKKSYIYISAIVIPPPSDRYSSTVPPLFLLPCSSTLVPPLLFLHPALFKRLLSMRRQRAVKLFQYKHEKIKIGNSCIRFAVPTHKTNTRIPVLFLVMMLYVMALSTTLSKYHPEPFKGKWLSVCIKYKPVLISSKKS